MDVETIGLEAKFTQGVTVELLSTMKRTFRLQAADGETVASYYAPNGEILQFKYNSKSHARALKDWPGAPVIINHGKPEVKVVGQVVGADISENGLILDIRVDDDRVLEIISKNVYEGFSIGTSANANDPLSVDKSNNTILRYSPRELSVIMYPLAPACPKGVCDIVSMKTSCTHSLEIESELSVKNDEVKRMAEEVKSETVNAEASAPKKNCGCGGHDDFVSMAEYKVALATKDEKIAAIDAELVKLKASLDEKEKLILGFENEKRVALASSLPKIEGLDYSKMSITELTNLVVLHSNVKTESAGAVESKVEDAKVEPKASPWIPRKMQPGKY